ncbi:MAG: alpha/beta fold hydrolase [Brevefilum sp.]|jgi:pimeloyl-ACP methyl ester carboxylesterase
MTNQEKYQKPMEPWPSLKPFEKKIYLSEIDINLFYYDSGDEEKTPVVMIHGLGDEADTWRHVFAPIAKHFRAIAIDLPGFGRSDKPDRDYTPEFMKKAIIGLSDRLHLSEMILMGSSMGGILAQSLALEHAQRIKGLILVGGTLLQVDPMGDKGLMLMKLPFLGEWLYTRLRKNPDAAFESLRSVYFNLDQLPEPDRDFLFQRVNQRVWDNGQRRAYFSSLRHLFSWVKLSQVNLPDLLAHLTTPTLVVRGEFDALMSAKNAEGLINGQPNATLATIKTAGHLPHQEQSSDFVKIVLKWLTELG